MPRNRLTLLRTRVLIPIMLAAVTDENTTHSVQLLDELDALQAICSSARRRTQGTFPDVTSS
jgi:hypothetical protein